MLPQKFINNKPVGLLEKHFRNAHVIVQVLKRLLIKNVCIIVSTLIKHFVGDVIGDFYENVGYYFLRANPCCTTSAVSVQLQVHL
ncbi:hypothetical protein AB205_0182830 [Aquarana catesbeiana]|uniref:Uncharacterized protein n=1 Tax=Aquarana catesbeiana TaxID=8400 RepID=A0A2G9Q4X5_AQUCT|nr:hypothetical protein AB205_0182830 [Aquarana catesbeiana]